MILLQRCGLSGHCIFDTHAQQFWILFEGGILDNFREHEERTVLCIFDPIARDIILALGFNPSSAAKLLLVNSKAAAPME